MDHHYATQQDRSELAEEVRFFREHSTKLKQMFKETVTVLSDLQSFNESLSLDVILDVQAQRCVRLAGGVACEERGEMGGDVTLLPLSHMYVTVCMMYR